jgi:hypothetical protein
MVTIPGRGVYPLVAGFQAPILAPGAGRIQPPPRLPASPPPRPSDSPALPFPQGAWVRSRSHGSAYCLAQSGMPLLASGWLSLGAGQISAGWKAIPAPTW